MWIARPIMAATLSDKQDGSACTVGAAAYNTIASPRRALWTDNLLHGAADTVGASARRTDATAEHVDATVDRVDATEHSAEWTGPRVQ
jgi:hypothetical protein